MLAIRNGGICSPFFSSPARFFEAAEEAMANELINNASRGFLAVARIESVTTRTTPFVMYS
jgi:hypothetical protein